MLIFHAATCHFCADELPHLLAYARANPKVAVWIVAPSDLDAVKKQFADAPNNLRIVEDAADKDAGTKQFNAYRAEGTPTQILVNGKGNITWRGTGFSVQGANPFEAGKLPLE
ncbi:TlpA family protein disulfide reductase [Deinococcus oregonensis]|uniref:TlpA family protein disulfide reductase n=1 Tax=Deinococcus oregonensis TaxID=1805970 RepID=A0ABV6AYS3_9DEIO